MIPGASVSRRVVRVVRVVRDRRDRGDRRRDRRNSDFKDLLFFYPIRS